MAAQIPKLMTRFETEQLKKYTPCIFSQRQDVIRALAEVHTELVLIHPFREGNGRCSRILASIMALQAGLPVLDFSLISGSKKEDYPFSRGSAAPLVFCLGLSSRRFHPNAFGDV